MAGQHESWTTMRVALLEEARMRGDEDGQADVWSYIPLEQRVPADHPLRPMRAMVDAILVELSPQFNNSIPAWAGRRFRPSSCCGRCCCRFSTASGASG